MRLSVFTLLFSLVAAFHTVIPTQAEAASALFRVKRSWIGLGPTTTGGYPSTYIGTDYHPPTKGPSKAPPAVGGVAGLDFTIPSKIIKDYTGSFACPTFMACRPGYPVSVSYNSYYNANGSFRAFNPYGATTTTSVVFPTTMGNPSPPRATGDPLSPTTTFSGAYDFLREGSIMITPGSNRFGGTMKFFYGPNQVSYRYITAATSYIARAIGGKCGKRGCGGTTFAHDSYPGDTIVGSRRYLYRYTLYGLYRTTFHSVYSGTAYYNTTSQDISTVAPWTTGQVTIRFITNDSAKTWASISQGGYDNRTAKGVNGVISLVRPRLVHSYAVSNNPILPIVKVRSFGEIWRLDVHFLPEPGGVMLLTVGFATLVCLYRLRR